MNKQKLLIFASGTETGGGSGFAKLVEASKNPNSLNAEIVGVVSNHHNGGVRAHADCFGIPFIYFPGPWTGEIYQRIAQESGANYFALSGWEKLVKGLDLNTNFNSKTVFNIHPGPLPGFGGKGMYGRHVHEAVLKAYQEKNIKNSEICMHFVTPKYDLGPVFFRLIAQIKPEDTVESLAERINRLEHYYQPQITNQVLNGKISWDGVNEESLYVENNIIHFELMD